MRKMRILIRRCHMKISKFLLNSAAITTFGVVFLIGEPTKAETLKDAIRQAYLTNPEILQRRAEQRINDENYVSTRSNLGPSLSIGSNTSYSDSPSFMGKSSTSLSLNLNQTLFASGGLSSSVRAAENNVKAGQKSLMSFESGLVLDVIDVFTGVRRNQEAFSIANENYSVLKRQLDETKAMFQAGQLTRTDVAQSEARLSASEAGLSNARAILEGSRAAYRALIGQTPIGLEAEPDLPLLPEDFDKALKLAEENNFSLQSALYNQKASQDRLKAAKSVFGPQVRLNVNGAQSAPTDRLSELSENKSAGANISVAIPLFSSGLNSSDVRKAKESLNIADQSVELAKRAVLNNLSQSWSQMLATRAATQANEKQVEAAKIAAQGVKTEYQVGLRTNIEVLNAEQELRSAQLSLLDARRGQYLASAQVLLIMGSLTPNALVNDLEVYDATTNFKKVRNKNATPVDTIIKTIDGLAAGK